MELRNRYPKLTSLLGGYLHQDWKECYLWDGKPHYAPIVRFFKTNNSQSTVQEAATELKDFLSKEYDEERLEDALYHHFILGLMPSSWGMTFKEWLEDILKILEEPIEKTKKQYIPYQA